MLYLYHTPHTVMILKVTLPIMVWYNASDKLVSVCVSAMSCVYAKDAPCLFSIDIPLKLGLYCQNFRVVTGAPNGFPAT